ncbi:serine hydrolase domain-containing protein [Virgisporangium ochraceum]|uniref:serine hydrolase domain-containing protein n=1 Tax=Virgisporangium ochraceum TaxID=65505 RepID=UPI0019442AA4|nr:serine hydrolase domain-containing protein [Virgisporangium ochraceum]
MTARIDAVLRSAVDSGAMPNVVGVAADRTGVLYEGAAGPRAVGGSEPIDAESIFRIASMTKMVCTVAALQQRDLGNLDFEAPVDSYCPDFAAVEVLDGCDETGKPKTRAPASRATVRQLVTHTAGLAYGFWNPELTRWEAATATGDVFSTPMVADPGTRFEYGISTDWLGRVVESASGRSLDRYLADHIFRPLGMRSTAFLLDDEQRAACVPVHVRDEAGNWIPTDLDWDRQPAWWAGGHGLYSTPRDYLLFQRMLLAGGTLADATVLAPSSVRGAFTNQIGDLWFPPEIRTIDPAVSCDFTAGPGMKWGWGLLLDTRGRPGGRNPGSGGWVGVFNTYFWIDPEAGIAGALYSQSRPLATPEALKTYTDFERAVYSDSQ